MEIKIDVPDGKSGNWSVESFTVSKEDEKFEQLRAAISSSSRGRYTPAGTYKALKCNNKTIMSNTPDEIRDFRYFIHKATGKVLVNGLGLGVILKALVDKPDIEHVTVIEISQDVINLVGPTFKDNPKVTIIHADAFTYKPPKGVRYNAVWNDIWDDICIDNLESMSKLHRKYGKKTDFQDSWGRDICLMRKRKEKRFEYA